MLYYAHIILYVWFYTVFLPIKITSKPGVLVSLHQMKTDAK